MTPAPAGVSVGVGRVDVLGQRLLIVAALTEWLPVVLVPEKFLVTTVRNDVIHTRVFDLRAAIHCINSGMSTAAVNKQAALINNEVCAGHIAIKHD